MRSTGGWWLSVMLMASCATGQGGGRQATPPMMSTADPQMAQMTTPPDNPDTDHDGVLDDVDRCPTAIEDKDGFEDSDGCPDPDNDADGVLDTADQCPNDPETVNGYQDSDGCPDHADPIGPLWCYQRSHAGAAPTRVCKPLRDDCEATRAVADRKASGPCVEEGAK